MNNDGPLKSLSPNLISTVRDVLKQKQDLYDDDLRSQYPDEPSPEPEAPPAEIPEEPAPDQT